MRADQAPRPATRLRLAMALVAAAALPACTGDNLFTGLGAFTGLLGPEVDITAPPANQAVAVGAPVQVTAKVSSPDGVTQVKFTGLFTTGSTAFNEVLVTGLPSPQDTTISRSLTQAPGGATGSVRIIVEAQDALGDKGADTVVVIIQ